MTVGENVFARFEGQGVLILDGGLATTLEARGYELDDPLWSARVLLESPEAIRDVHREFLEAGADCITTATYQASIPGLCARGLSPLRSERLLRDAVGLALDARDEFWEDPGRGSGRIRPLVAASVGPYGAYLADGSEYTGAYGVGPSELFDFHARRLEVLAESASDLLACETIPSRDEADVLLELLPQVSKPAWISFSCRDEEHLCDGSSWLDAVRACSDAEGVTAVGVNCTAPAAIAALLEAARSVTAKPLIVYPNSGERYDASSGSWQGEPSRHWQDGPSHWKSLGATAMGGCCRVGPAQISELRRRVL